MTISEHNRSASWQQLQTTWSNTFIEALVSAGIKRFVISPGSRSTPLVSAALASSLSCTAIIDERSASFFAVGQSKFIGVPTALLCTSGTAAAHYYPAIVEAYYSFTPLIVVTADRPSELQACGAPQTIDQIGLFTNYTRFRCDLGPPDPQGIAAVARKAVQAAYYATSPLPGPVHINVPMRKPLEPIHISGATPESAPPIQTRMPLMVANKEALTKLIETCNRAEKGLVIAGPLQPHQAELSNAVARFLQCTGFPLLCETTSQLRFTDQPAANRGSDGFPLFLQSPTFTAMAQPDWILQLGGAPASAQLSTYLASQACDRFVLSEGGWTDPTSTSTALIFGDMAHSLSALTTGLADFDPASHQRTQWHQLFATASAITSQCLSTELEPRDTPLAEGAAVRTIMQAAPPESVIALGNGSPIRSADVYCDSLPKPLTVWCQRGANGIDGLIAGAAGAATTHEKPTILILGDVGFAHDIASLAVARNATTPLVIVVIDNQGGRIFEKLPIATNRVMESDFEQYWLTPPGLDLRDAATLYNVAFFKAESAQSLESSLRQASQQPNCTLIHAVVAPNSALDIETRLATAVDNVLSSQQLGEQQ